MLAHAHGVTNSSSKDAAAVRAEAVGVRDAVQVVAAGVHRAVEATASIGTADFGQQRADH